MKTTEKVMLQAGCIGAVAAGALYWFAPSLPWWVYAIVAAIVYSVSYTEGVKQKAAENLANKDVTKP